MEKNFIPYGRQQITSEDIEAVNSVLRGELITQGPVAEVFEKEIAKKVKAEYAISTNSATSALHLCCLALDLGEGDYLWTSPNTFVASANCALYCGASVDFIDIDIKNGLMSIERLKIKLEHAEKIGKLPKIIIPVHFSGSSCEMREIYKLSKKYGFKIVEDASHAIGGEYLDKPVGCCEYSHLSVFSFHPVKIITTGEGGVITTNNPILARRVRELRSHGITKDKNKFINKVSFSWSYEQQELGFNYRMSDINASLGLSQLKRLTEIVIERNRLFSYYFENFKKLPLKLLEIPPNVKSSIHLAVIVLDKELSPYHSLIFDNLRQSKIGVQLHYIPVHTQPYYQKLGFNKEDFPESVNYASRAFSIPLFPGLSHSEQEFVLSQIKININRFL